MKIVDQETLDSLELSLEKMNDKRYSELLKRKDIFHTSFVNLFFEFYDEYLIIFENLTDYNNISTKILKDRKFKESLILMLIPDLSWERALTNFRKNVCLKSVNDFNPSKDLTSLLQSLAVQCFMTDYVYEVSKEELSALKVLKEKCKEDLSLLSIISCYIPLYNLVDEVPSIKDHIPRTKFERSLFKIQLKEPLEELKLSKTIEKIGVIQNNISEKVRNQYLENPYPKWRYVYFTPKQSAVSLEVDLRASIHTNYLNLNLSLIREPKILIAGCGTGQQVISASSYYNAKITAIDLSENSLCYAKRKAQEYGMNDVRFIHMDILNLKQLGEKFDLIECGGVLHHMENPKLGLLSLCDSLHTGGYMKLGLYSKIARSSIRKAHEIIKTLGIECTSEGIREFRKKVFSGDLKELEDLTTMSIDFYGLSTCRDLCFHACEHQFTIKEINSLLDECNLQFCGFNLPNFIKEEYLNYFPSDKSMTNLNNWELFEEENPHTFTQMYQFIVRSN